MSTSNDNENIEVIVDDIIAKMIEEGERAEEEFVDEELNARDHLDKLGDIVTTLTYIVGVYADLVATVSANDHDGGQ